MTMTVAMRPSSEAAPASPSSKRSGLRGPRPQRLKVSSTSSSRGSSPGAYSKPSSGSRKAAAAGAAPVIVYENTPKVVHARPQEFMSVVQRLTGKPAATTAAPVPYAPAAVDEGSDPLLLTLGQRSAAAVLPSSVAAGPLMSPSFVFSPNTMQSIQELSPLF